MVAATMSVNEVTNEKALESFVKRMLTSMNEVNDRMYNYIGADDVLRLAERVKQIG